MTDFFGLGDSNSDSSDSETEQQPGKFPNLAEQCFSERSTDHFNMVNLLAKIILMM